MTDHRFKPGTTTPQTSRPRAHVEDGHMTLFIGGEDEMARAMPQGIIKVVFEEHGLETRPFIRCRTFRFSSYSFSGVATVVICEYRTNI